MEIVSWNLNGLMAVMKSDSLGYLKELGPDVVCFQEIRTQQEPVVLEGYHHYWNHGEVDGYSGTTILTREEPIRVMTGFCSGFPDEEGRVLTIELKNFYLVTAYFPAPRDENLRRRAFRRAWDEALLDYIETLHEEKPVILCGDFNVAREPIDIFEGNMRQYYAQQGYTSDERSDLETLIDNGFTDAFRALHPGVQSFTWWSRRLNKRRENRGWRLDYFLVADELMRKVRDVRHLSDVEGSDHCPILLEAAL